MIVKIEKGTPECREQCHKKGCTEEIAFACTCDERLLVEPGRILTDTRNKDETIDRISMRKATQKIEDQTQMMQLSLAQTMNERGDRDTMRRFDR